MISSTSGNTKWVFGVLIAASALFEAIGKLLPPRLERPWPMMAALTAAGVTCIALGVRARSQRPRLVLERETGRELLRCPRYAGSLVWGLFFLSLTILIFGTGAAK